MQEADLVLEMIKGQKTIVDAAKEYYLKKSKMLANFINLRKSSLHIFDATIRAISPFPSKQSSIVDKNQETNFVRI